ncbi:nucleoside 2-deoxyribosyltransferase [Aquabacter cavernae]|uniref:nucleoside 2-deoxyribosyltransferase n=1 Tax=Aquabacter cavernae TaxID=2496029 RepID=UPI000F8DF171|nr:nucleoside 2-deoxyribosyltransferase [Aquabacter cavernae]
MRTLYLAGPDIFRPDAETHGARLKQVCAAHGLKGLYPLDGAPPEAGADAIRRKCMAEIDSADAVVANISPFRGPHMDPGTAFELGYAEARRKPVFLWSDNPHTLIARVGSATETGWRDGDGHLVEDFGGRENLMIALPESTVFDTPDAAIAAAADHLADHAPSPRPVPRPTLGLLQMIGIAALVALAAGYLGDRFLFK